MFELKMSANIIQKCSSKDLTSKPKSNFNYTVATQGDTGGIWAQNKFKFSDLLAEQKTYVFPLIWN